MQQVYWARRAATRGAAVPRRVAARVGLRGAQEGVAAGTARKGVEVSILCCPVGSLFQSAAGTALLALGRRRHEMTSLRSSTYMDCIVALNSPMPPFECLNVKSPRGEFSLPCPPPAPAAPSFPLGTPRATSAFVIHISQSVISVAAHCLPVQGLLCHPLQKGWGGLGWHIDCCVPSQLPCHFSCPCRLQFTFCLPAMIIPAFRRAEKSNKMRERRVHKLGVKP